MGKQLMEERRLHFNVHMYIYIYILNINLDGISECHFSIFIIYNIFKYIQILVSGFNPSPKTCPLGLAKLPKLDVTEKHS